MVVAVAVAVAVAVVDVDDVVVDDDDVVSILNSIMLKFFPAISLNTYSCEEVVWIRYLMGHL